MFYLTLCSLNIIGVFPANQPSHKASGHPSVKVGGRSFSKVVDISALEASKTLAHRTMELLRENTKPKGICHRHPGLGEILIFIITSHVIFLWMESWHRGCAEGGILGWSHDGCRTRQIKDRVVWYHNLNDKASSEPSEVIVKTETLGLWDWRLESGRQKYNSVLKGPIEYANRC